MICVIRIKGKIGLTKEINETFRRLRLGKKYTCIVIKQKKEQLGMINKIRNFVAFGEIKENDFEKLIEKRGHPIDKKKKINPKEIVEGIKKGKKYQDFNLKPYFRLHPPRKGINTKQHFPKGALGNHKEKINDLVERML